MRVWLASGGSVGRSGTAEDKTNISDIPSHSSIRSLPDNSGWIHLVSYSRSVAAGRRRSTGEAVRPSHRCGRSSVPPCRCPTRSMPVGSPVCRRSRSRRHNTARTASSSASHRPCHRPAEYDSRSTPVLNEHLSPTESIIHALSTYERSARRSGLVIQCARAHVAPINQSIDLYSPMQLQANNKKV